MLAGRERGFHSPRSEICLQKELNPGETLVQAGSLACPNRNRQDETEEVSGSSYAPLLGCAPGIGRSGLGKPLMRAWCWARGRRSLCKTKAAGGLWAGAKPCAGLGAGRWCLCPHGTAVEAAFPVRAEPVPVERAAVAADLQLSQFCVSCAFSCQPQIPPRTQKSCFALPAGKERMACRSRD